MSATFAILVWWRPGDVIALGLVALFAALVLALLIWEACVMAWRWLVARWEAWRHE